MTETNTRVLFNSTPEGLPTPDNFRLEEAPVPEPGAGQFLLRNLYLSLDPYQRMLMGGGWTYSPNVLKPGDLMVGRVLGEVVKTNHPDFPVGTHVVGRLGWQTHVVSDGADLDFVVEPKDRVPLSAYLGVCGSTGVTAWVGLKITGQPKAGETVVVSAAAGSVGSCVGQLAKDMGCRAVGIAGGPDKCKLVVDEFGFDACVDYKAPDLAGQLKAAAPDGVDVYFDNVGGEILETVMGQCNRLARIPVCGVLARYNETGAAHGNRNMHLFFDKSLKMEGFVLNAHKAIWPQARAELEAMVADGRMRYRETIAQGIETAPEAFIGMLQGKNVGKQLVKLT
ncbi:NADP-dependent oxidoreductase [Thalassospiraceae bacterium LMO-SO8]|nr:NADP-dependent oxidoreductase [Alphaproteobacteria bacterium LMO-S08]WND77420.1 NADP-dependent oxidoreductase [Thalassospiraceae bacterium LMO-SO8]